MQGDLASYGFGSVEMLIALCAFMAAPFEKNEGGSRADDNRKKQVDPEHFIHNERNEDTCPDAKLAHSANVHPVPRCTQIAAISLDASALSLSLPQTRGRAFHALQFFQAAGEPTRESCFGHSGGSGLSSRSLRLVRGVCSLARTLLGITEPSHKPHEQPPKPNDSHRHKPDQSMHLRDRGKNGCHQRDNKNRQTIYDTLPRCMGAGDQGLTKKRLEAPDVTRRSNLGGTVVAMFLKFAALFSRNFEPLQKSTTVTFAHFPSNLTRHNQRVSRTQASSQVRRGTLGSLLRIRANEPSSGKNL